MSPHARFLLVAVTAGAAILAASSFVFSPLISSSAAAETTSYETTSAAMSPTYEWGIAVALSEPDGITAGSVVLTHVPHWRGVNDHSLLRVVAVEGQLIEFKSGDVLVDGEPIAEGFLDADHQTFVDNDQEIPGCDPSPNRHSCRVPADSAFLLGDNRLAAADSRLHGPVPLDSIVAEATDSNR